MESTNIPGWGSYILAIFLTPIYCLSRGKWLGFVLSTILYILAGLTMFIFGLGLIFWGLAAFPAAFSLRNEILEAHANNIGEATAKAIAALGPRSISPAEVGFVEANKLSEGKICPKCAESVKEAAVICRHCGHKFTDLTQESDASLGANTTSSCSVASNATAIPHSEMPIVAIVKPPDTDLKIANNCFCTQCGTNVVESSLFCCECGYRICAET